MRLITFGLGGPARELVTLGLATTAPQGGSYVTLGQGQSVSRFLAFGLSPRFAVGPVVGSYVTFGQAQSAPRFLLLGLRPGAVPVGNPLRMQGRYSRLWFPRGEIRPPKDEGEPPCGCP